MHSPCDDVWSCEECLARLDDELATAMPFARPGSGDELAAVLADAPPGLVVELGAGTYSLTETVVVRGDLVVRTEPGAERKVVLESSAPGAALVVEAGDFQLQDLELAHVGAEAADVVVVRGGRCDLANLVIKGGRASRARAGPRGHGIVVSGDALAIVSRTESRDHRGDGVRVGDHARLEWSYGYLATNGGAGIRVTGGASVRVQYAETNWSRGDGVALEDDAHAVLIGCRLRSSRVAGLRASGSAIVAATDLHCTASKTDGVRLEGRARGTLWQPRLLRNKGFGLVVADKAAAAVAEPTYQRNAAGREELARPLAAITVEPPEERTGPRRVRPSLMHLGADLPDWALEPERVVEREHVTHPAWVSVFAQRVPPGAEAGFVARLLALAPRARHYQQIADRMRQERLPALLALVPAGSTQVALPDEAAVVAAWRALPLPWSWTDPPTLDRDDIDLPDQPPPRTVLVVPAEVRGAVALVLPRWDVFAAGEI